MRREQLFINYSVILDKNYHPLVVIGGSPLILKS